MNEMIEHSMKVLELPAVLSLLADCAVSEEAKTQCLNLRPQTDPTNVEELQQQTEAARHLILVKGTPGLPGRQGRGPISSAGPTAAAASALLSFFGSPASFAAPEE